MTGLEVLVLVACCIVTVGATVGAIWLCLRWLGVDLFTEIGFRRIWCEMRGHDMQAAEFEYPRPNQPPATLRVCSRCGAREITLWPAERR